MNGWKHIPPRPGLPNRAAVKRTYGGSADGAAGRNVIHIIDEELRKTIPDPDPSYAATRDTPSYLHIPSKTVAELGPESRTKVRDALQKLRELGDHNAPIGSELFAALGFKGNACFNASDTKKETRNFDNNGAAWTFSVPTPDTPSRTGKKLPQEFANNLACAIETFCDNTGGIRVEQATPNGAVFSVDEMMARQMIEKAAADPTRKAQLAGLVNNPTEFIEAMTSRAAVKG